MSHAVRQELSKSEKQLLARLHEKERYFRDFGIWPNHARFDTAAWLGNFQEGEQPTAHRLLSSFIYFNDALTTALFRGALQNFLSSTWKDNRFSHPPQEIELSTIAFVVCEGEEPHPTDSGNLFARKLRDQINVPERCIMRPGEALRRADEFRHIVFFDDFSGSGNQFADTMNRRWTIGVEQISHAELLSSGQWTVCYCPSLCTTRARDRILTEFNNLQIWPAHLIGAESSLVLEHGRIWSDVSPESAREEIEIMRVCSHRAGYAAEDGSEEDWRGFHALGLGLAFEHGIPDASLPIFYSTRNGWSPLVRRAQ